MKALRKKKTITYIVHERTFQLFKWLKKGKEYQSFISSFGVRTEPISRNSIKLSSLSNRPFYFSVTFPYFSRKRHIVSLPFVICHESAL